MQSQDNSSDPPANTSGLLLRCGTFYDGLVTVLTLGQSARLRRSTIDLAAIKPGDRVLDVGCGTGGVTIPARHAAGSGGRVSGIDPSPEMIAVARRKASKIGVDIDFRIGVIESLPYPDESFDVVTSSLMMHHLPESLRKAGLREIYRVLKPGGGLLIVDALRPGGVILEKVYDAIARRHGVKFGIEELPGQLTSVGFSEAMQLPERLLGLGFVRAVKPSAG